MNPNFTIQSIATMGNLLPGKFPAQSAIDHVALVGYKLKMFEAEKEKGNQVLTVEEGNPKNEKLPLEEINIKAEWQGELLRRQ
jgi:hypothetical protein